MERMNGSTVRLRRKRPGSYHHGDLRRALIQQALHTILTQGIDRLTLREVGARLGVSRTALYRHFADKSALLAAVAREGFRTLRLQLVEAWTSHGGGVAGFEAMGRAYVQFALTHPSHYRVMFGGSVDASTHDAELAEEAAGAFQALVDALVAQQQSSLVRADDPLQLARFVWATVHGVALLLIDGRIPDSHGQADALIAYAIARIRTGIEAGH